MCAAAGDRTTTGLIPGANAEDLKDRLEVIAKMISGLIAGLENRER